MSSSPNSDLPSRQRTLKYLALSLLVTVLALLLALSIGSQKLQWAQLFEPTSLTHTLVFQLRLPRVLVAFMCGSLLAVTGALLQLLLRNPLADPSVLGVSGGASVGALLALLFGLSGVSVSLAAALGASLATLLLFAVSARSLFGAPLLHLNHDAPVRLLLAGVMLATACGALVSLVLSLAPEANVRGMLFWLLGDLSAAQPNVLAGLVCLGTALLAAYWAPSFNLLMLGETQAFSLGVNVRRLRWQCLVLAALATGVAVTLAGPIGFVGLLVPHVLRRWLGHDQRLVLPAAALLGGAFLALADALARTVAAPLQLPVGVITALIGVPVFWWGLFFNQGQHAQR